MVTWWSEWRGSLDGRPTMWITYLLKRPSLQISLHKFVAPDDAECFHSHPATAIRCILWGGYTEELFSGRVVRWRVGHIGLVRPWLCHRIAELHGSASYSLWIRFRKTHEVGLYGAGWVRQTGGLS